MSVLTKRSRFNGSGPALSAHNLSAGYGPLAAVRNINIAVHTGEVVALLGANGAGKTTTLLTLAGELSPLAGEVRWNGVSTKAALNRRARHGLGLVTEERAVFMGLTVAENLRLGNGPTATALDLFPELKPLLKRKAGLLSGGEQQMLALGRALAGAPQVLLADELSLGLAPQLVRRLLRAVRNGTEHGMGVLLAEQHVRQALSVADRAYVLQRGRVVLEGSAEEMLTRIAEIEHTYLEGLVDNS
jgi:branched-chain amino acid transport system ATP-binding protein